MTSEELERLGSIQQELWAIYEFWSKFVCERSDGGIMPYGQFAVSFSRDADNRDYPVAGNEDSVDARQVCFEALVEAYRKRCVAILVELASAGITDQQEAPESLLV